jgi:hypothetical protein
MPPPLLSRCVKVPAVGARSVFTRRRTLDPVLGIFTGLFAFYLNENNPRTAPPEDQRLSTLVQWKMDQWKAQREEKLRLEAEMDWKMLTEQGRS